LELAGFFAFLREELVADALLDVVGLSGEQQERFVLSLPAEARDRSVIAIAVRIAGGQEPLRLPEDPERGFRRGVGRLVGDDGGVRDRFDESQAECRRGNAEDHVVASHLSSEVLLLDRAARGVAGLVDPATDDEQGVDSAVAGAVGLDLEARFAHGAVAPDERRHDVLRAERGGHADLRIHGRAGTASRRLGVTASAAVEIETRTEAVPDALHFDEGVLAGVEEGLLSGGECRETAAGAGGASANAGITSEKELSLSRTREKDGKSDHEERRSCSHARATKGIGCARPP